MTIQTNAIIIAHVSKHCTDRPDTGREETPMKKPRELHYIKVTFYNGQTATYTTAALYGRFGLQTDPAVFEIMDMETGEILYTID